MRWVIYLALKRKTSIADGGRKLQISTHTCVFAVQVFLPVGEFWALCTYLQLAASFPTARSPGASRGDGLCLVCPWHKALVSYKRRKNKLREQGVVLEGTERTPPLVTTKA